MMMVKACHVVCGLPPEDSLSIENSLERDCEAVSLPRIHSFAM